MSLLAVALLLVGLLQAETGAAREDKKARVGIVGFDYKPGTLKIDRGTRVVFANKSGTAHTATAKGAFDTGRIAPGKSAVVRFNRKGTYSYHCTLHPFMHGKIVVH